MANIVQTCAKCTRQFLIIEQEQKVLKEKGIPFPTNCSSSRQKRRLTLRGAERMLYKTNCQKCNREIIVAYDPSTVENMILCKKDYDQYFLENDSIIKDPLPEVSL